MFMVTTDAGNRVYAGDKGAGMEESQATASVADRNARASSLGLKTRYVVAPFAATEKE